MLKTQLDVKASRYLTIVLMVTHLGAITMVWLANLPVWMAFLVTMFCLVSLYYTLSQHAIRWGRQAIVSIKQNEGDSWLLIDNRGASKVGKLCGDSLVTTFLVILNFKVYQRFRILPIVIFSDSVDVNLFRRLRVSLTTSVKVV